MDDTQTTGPATDATGVAQTPTAQDTSSHRPEAPNGQTEIHGEPPEAPSGPPGFSERGRMRRRMRFLRKARELAYRDLGGLVFDLHRFGRRNDTLVLAKLETIGRIDTELRALQDTLAERRGVTVLREAGVAACPRCAAIHGSDDRFCPHCGLAMDLRAERPMAGPQTAAQAAPTPPSPAPAPAPALAPAQAAATTPTPAPTPSPPPAPTPAPQQTSAPAPTPSPPPAPAPTPSPPPASTQPVGPAPTVDQPTEIVRPPIQDP